MPSEPSVVADEFDAHCTHCGVVVAIRVIASFDDSCGPGMTVFGTPDTDVLIRTRLLLGRCPRCGRPFLASEKVTDVECWTSDPEIVVLFPAISTRVPLDSLPPLVRTSYAQAARCLEASLFEPCAIMCRKCVEAVCHTLGESKGSLASRLKALRSSGAIDDRLATWADQLRLVGNDAAHELGVEITKQDAQDSLDFVEAILLYAFTLRTRFEAFCSRRRRIAAPSDSET